MYKQIWVPMSVLFLGFVTFVLIGTAQAATVLFEDFEDSTVTYVAHPPDFLGNIANSNYFGRIDPGSGLPGSISYSNPQGSGFYGVRDMDDAIIIGSQLSLITLEWIGIDISSYTGLNLSWFVAEDNDIAGPHWDPDTSVRLNAQIDGGGFNPIFAIESEGLINTSPRVDTNFDGDGDGVVITDTFTQFASAIADGNVLDLILRIENLDAGNEDIAFDNLLLTGNSTSPNPVPTPSAMLLMGTGLIGLVGWRWWTTKTA